ncbi:MAG: DUF3226 domain-containing protein [Armatimonadota bacterium]
MTAKGAMTAAFTAAHPKVLLVEGKDEFYLLLQLLEEPVFADQVIDVQMYDGTGGLAKTLKTLRHSAPTGFRAHVTTLAVWRDADQDSMGSLQQVRDALQSASFAVPDRSGQFVDGPPRIGVFILPDGRNAGALENVCLASVGKPEVLSCVDGYLACLQATGTELHPNLGKSKLHTFLASREEPGLKIGEAAKARYWNFTHPAWQPLIDFLKAM